MYGSTGFHYSSARPQPIVGDEPIPHSLQPDVTEPVAGIERVAIAKNNARRGKRQLPYRVLRPGRVISFTDRTGCLWTVSHAGDRLYVQARLVRVAMVVAATLRVPTDKVYTPHKVMVGLASAGILSQEANAALGR